jgi:hypothetical protein
MAFFNPVGYLVERMGARALERRTDARPVQAVSD